jgi:CubicO group peptidase (beta-lactamase class C family)
MLAATLVLNPTLAMDKIVHETLTQWEIPGCAVTIIRQDEILLCKGYGVTQLSNPEPIDIHTRFPIASLSKLFTSLAIGLLVDQEKLTLDTPILQFNPTLKLSDPYATEHLTFRDCLSMHSGLPGSSGNEPINADFNAAQLLEALPFPLGFRSHFAYQNLLYLLAATPLKSYETFLHKHLLKPLDMTETLLSYSALQDCPNKIQPHVWKENQFEEVPLENLDAILPAAGINSTAHDMKHFLYFLLHDGTYHARAILSPSTLSQIFTPQTTATVKEFTGDPADRDILFPTAQFLTYGLGCFIHDYRGIKMIQVPGLTDGTNSVLAIVPSLQLGIFITCNAESAKFTHALLFKLVDNIINSDQNKIK